MSKRTQWIDIARGIGIILVVAGHSVAGMSPPAIAIYSFHMPFFFLLAGYLMNYAKYREDFVGLITSRFKSLILPYIGIAIAYFAFPFWAYSHLGFPAGHTPREILRDTLISFTYGVGQGVRQFPKLIPAGGAWFLTALFSATVIFWVLLRLTERGLAWRAGTAVVLSVVGVLLGRWMFLPWNVDLALAAQFFVWVGYEVRQRRVLQRLNPFALGGVLVLVWFVASRFSYLSMNDRGWENPPIAYIAAIAGSILVLIAARALARVPVIAPALAAIGRDTIPILAFHGKYDLPLWSTPYMQYFARTIWGLIGANLAYGLFVAWLIRRVPLMKSLFYWDRFPLPLAACPPDDAERPARPGRDPAAASVDATAVEPEPEGRTRLRRSG